MIAIRRNLSRTVLLSFIVLLLLVLAGQVGWNWYIAPRLAIRRIVLEDDLGLSNAQILEMLDVGGETWASIEPEDLAARLEAYPVVRKARVVKVFPDTLKLFIYRRKPLVAAFADNGGKVVPVVFDEEGYAVLVGPGPGIGDIPVLSGPAFPQPDLGARLAEPFRIVLGNLSNLRNDDPGLFNLVSEIELIESDEAFDLKLYLNHVQIPVLIDRNLSADTVRQAVLILDVLESESAGRVTLADMRGGQVVYRRGEEG